MKTEVAALLGPTAVGKTELAVGVAERLRAEIVSIDSIQIYTGMNVGTAKPTADQRARVPHHLVDLLPVSHELTVAQFQLLARKAIADIAERGRLPLLVGGSGLYWRAVVDDLRFPPRSQRVRARLEAETAAEGGDRMHRRLHELDPVAAASIAPANARRTIRALEVIEITGRPFSEFAKEWTRYEALYDLRAAGLTRPRADLHRRIEARIGHMLANGLIEEAHRLGAGAMSRAARQALGYGQILEAGIGASRSEIGDAIARATRRFARRQESWFRSDPRIMWFEASAPRISEQLCSFLSSVRSGTLEAGA